MFRFLVSAWFAAVVAILVTLTPAVAQTSRHDLTGRHRRQSAHRSGDRPLVPDPDRGRSVRQRPHRQVAEGAVRHRLVRRRHHSPRRRQPGGARGREPDHQPHRLRRQPSPRERQAAGGNPAAAARRLQSLQGAGRRPAPARPLQAQRPVCRHGRAEDHQAGQQSRRFGLRDQRGIADLRHAHRLRRQYAFQRRRPEGRDRKPRGTLVPVPQQQRFVRPRPRQLRPRAVAQVLLAPWLCRLPRGCSRGAADARPAPFLPHLHRRGRRALQGGQGRSDQRATGHQGRRAQARDLPSFGRLVRRRRSRKDHPGLDRCGGQQGLRVRRHQTAARQEHQDFMSST